MSFEQCAADIGAAMGREVTPAEALDLMDRIQARADSIRATRADLADAELRRVAAEELAAQARAAAAVEARNKRLDLQRQAARRGLIDTAPKVGDTPGAYMGLKALLTGVNTPFAGHRYSVEARAKGLRTTLLRGMATEIRQTGVTSKELASPEFGRLVAREVFELNREGGKTGITKNKSAGQIAEIGVKYLDRAREIQNRAGAWIGQYEGRIARTAHDPDRIRRAGFESWRDYILPRLDERTFEGVTDRDAFLRSAWEALVSGVHLTQEWKGFDKAPAFKGPGNLAKRLSHERVLHWRDADGWFDYQQKFGAENLIAAWLGEMDSGSRNAALMEVFGTNPRYGFQADLEYIRATRRMDHNKSREVALTRRFDVLDGTAQQPVNRTLARVGQLIRMQQRTAKLGGIVISAVTDLAGKASELRYQGLPLLQAYSDGVLSTVRGRRGQNPELAAELGLGVEGMISALHARYDADDPSVLGKLSRWENLFFELTGISYWTDAQRTGAVQLMAHQLGKQQDRAWGTLKPESRRLLTGAGITPAEWEALRKLPWTTDEEGRVFLTPERARQIGDDALDELRAAEVQRTIDAHLDRLSVDVGQADKLARRIEKLQAVLDKMLPGDRDAEKLDIRATVDAMRRYQKTTAQLGQDVMKLRYGEAGKKLSPSKALERMAREVNTLARAERQIGEKFARQLAALKSKRARGEAAQDAAAQAIDGVRDALVERLERIERAPERLEKALADGRIRAREELALKLDAMYADRVDYAVLQAGVDERAILTGGTLPGTEWGEALRLITQFKSFPAAVLNKSWGRTLYGETARPAKVAAVIHQLTASILLGYVAQSLKEMSRGREPRDPANPGTWVAAMAQGGGAGIYGDFLFGAYSRTGNTALETLAGPFFPTASDFMNVIYGIREGEDPSAAALRLVTANTPFLNLAYTRWAIDYLVLFNLQEAMSPGYLQRHERRLARENNQKYLLPPSRVIPRGGGWPTSPDGG
ncbi:hypothetical protein TMO_0043 [Tistrella mobilis KA081020-065]|uniref:Uncharacterized protein n=1 Tax=Tistrella mobilis (strain KA081020-065) TaxID=1110502 RepID=I3TGJ4_TISMK|nr:hypothetical protein TMO_0043 [Tistrella mobilis KA081020-065]